MVVRREGRDSGGDETVVSGKRARGLWKRIGVGVVSGVAAVGGVGRGREWWRRAVRDPGPVPVCGVGSACGFMPAPEGVAAAWGLCALRCGVCGSSDASAGSACVGETHGDGEGERESQGSLRFGGSVVGVAARAGGNDGRPAAGSLREFASTAASMRGFASSSQRKKPQRWSSACWHV